MTRPGPDFFDPDHVKKHCKLWELTIKESYLNGISPPYVVPDIITVSCQRDFEKYPF